MMRFVSRVNDIQEEILKLEEKQEILLPGLSSKLLELEQVVSKWVIYLEILKLKLLGLYLHN